MRKKFKSRLGLIYHHYFVNYNCYFHKYATDGNHVMGESLGGIEGNSFKEDLKDITKLQ